MPPDPSLYPDAPPLRIPAQRLDELGRCCGRKPLVYKRPVHHLFCTRCAADFTPAGEQRANWAWKADGEGFVSSHCDNGHHDFIETMKAKLKAREA